MSETEEDDELEENRSYDSNDDYQLKIQKEEEELQKYEYQEYVYEDGGQSPQAKSPNNQKIELSNDFYKNEMKNMMEVPNFSFIRPSEACTN